MKPIPVSRLQLNERDALHPIEVATRRESPSSSNMEDEGLFVIY